MAIFKSKMIFTTAAAMLVMCFMSAPAYAMELIVGGQAVGIQMETDGVMVAGISEVETAEGSRSPAKDAGVKQGDYIIEADGRPAQKAADVIDAVERLGGQAVRLTVRRGEKLMKFTVTPVRAEERWAIGLWLRDGIGGIGTLTFFDPGSGTYGALGHSVSDADTGCSMPISGGSITEAQIVSVKPGSSGKPGELNGCADLGRVIGSIEKNSSCGIFGKCCISIDGRTLETGSMSPGPATILSTVNGRETGEYSVEINRIYRESDGVHAMLCVTDPALIDRTGGIVQGMSGSPILQNGRLVGAVTHVFVSDPTKGYAISIDDMLKAAGLFEEKAA